MFWLFSGKFISKRDMWVIQELSLSAFLLSWYSIIILVPILRFCTATVFITLATTAIWILFPLLTIRVKIFWLVQTKAIKSYTTKLACLLDYIFFHIWLWFFWSTAFSYKTAAHLWTSKHEFKTYYPLILYSSWF